METKFKVGDKVVAVHNGSYYKKGDVGEVETVDFQDRSMTYFVSFTNGESVWVYNTHIEAEQKPPQVLPFQSLSLEEVEQVFNSLPGGLEGFCKGWGWYDFARGIELLSKQKNGG